MNTNHVDDLYDDLPWWDENLWTHHPFILHDTLRNNYSHAASCHHGSPGPLFTATSCQHSPSCFTCPLPDCSWPH